MTAYDYLMLLFTTGECCIGSIENKTSICLKMIFPKIVTLDNSVIALCWRNKQEKFLVIVTSCLKAFKYFFSER